MYRRSLCFLVVMAGLGMLCLSAQPVAGQGQVVSATQLALRDAWARDDAALIQKHLSEMRSGIERDALVGLFAAYAGDLALADARLRRALQATIDTSAALPAGYASAIDRVQVRLRERGDLRKNSWHFVAAALHYWRGDAERASQAFRIADLSAGGDGLAQRLAGSGLLRVRSAAMEQAAAGDYRSALVSMLRASAQWPSPDHDMEVVVLMLGQGYTRQAGELFLHALKRAELRPGLRPQVMAPLPAAASSWWHRPGIEKALQAMPAPELPVSASSLSQELVRALALATLGRDEAMAETLQRIRQLLLLELPAGQREVLEAQLIQLVTDSARVIAAGGDALAPTSEAVADLLRRGEEVEAIKVLLVLQSDKQFEDRLPLLAAASLLQSWLAAPADMLSEKGLPLLARAADQVGAWLVTRAEGQATAQGGAALGPGLLLARLFPDDEWRTLETALSDTPEREPLVRAQQALLRALIAWQAGASIEKEVQLLGALAPGSPALEALRLLTAPAREASTPQTPAELFGQAQAAFSEGQFQQAYNLLLAVGQRDAGYTGLQDALLQVSVAMQRWDRAGHALTAILDGTTIDSTSKARAFKLGVRKAFDASPMLQKQYALAIDELRILCGKPEFAASADHWYLLGHLEFDDGRYARSWLLLDTYIEKIAARPRGEARHFRAASLELQSTSTRD